MKQHYLDMIKENIFATIGIIYVILAEVTNLFLENNARYNSQLKIILITIILGFLLLIISYFIVTMILYIINKKEKEMIKVDDKLIEDGAIAIQTFEEDSTK